MDDSLSLVLVFCFILLTPREKVDLLAILDFFAKRLLIAELLWLLLIIKLFSIARLLFLCRLDNPKRTESIKAIMSFSYR
jgi:hypothetical protein